MKNEIIKYIVDQYEAHTIILYGSYANGSNNINSDFDALVITDKESKFHDGNIFAGIKLDIFIYNTEIFKKDIDYEEYVQIYDGNIVIDKYGIGKKLQQEVYEFIKNTPIKSKEEKEYLVKWCEKMFLRTKREDAEGYFRWHWLLVDSLEIYFNICNEYYHGPKKSLAKLKEQNVEAFNYYNNALTKFDSKSLEEWIMYLKGLENL